MTGDRNPRRKEGLTPLDQADGKVNFEAYTFIMEKLENKSTGNKRGKTPFHFADERGQLSNCKLIIKSIDYNNSHIAAELGHFEICQLKTENIEVKNPIQQWSPLHQAALNGCFDICELIIDYGVENHQTLLIQLHFN